MISYASNKQNDKTAVVYLARCAEGIAAFRRFADSYRLHQAAMPHELVVIYKGFEQTALLKEARGIFAEIPHRAIQVDDSGFDIGSYFIAARQLDHRLVCCLNTHTELQADGWLALLHHHASRPEVGIAGAMGSYESLSDSFRSITNVIWLCNNISIPYDERLLRYYGFLIDDQCQDWKATHGARKPTSSLGRISRSIKSRIGSHRLRSKFQRYWDSLIVPGAILDRHNRFPAFPNPHVRTNGFMMSRQRLLESCPGSIKEKMDCFEFESGLESLARQLRRRGLEALVVGRDGKGYDVANWWRSGTFRLGEQSNLLLSDNQSRNFTQLSPPEQATHVRMSWGDYVKPAPADFLDFGQKFAVDPGVVDPARPVRRHLKAVVLEQQARIDALEESCRVAEATSLKMQLLAESRERQFREVLDSFCWRCTRPIRVVGTFGRRVKRLVS